MKKRLLLRVLRAAHEPRLTQTKLARRAGVAAFRYWQIENGEGPATTIAEKSRIAEALGVDVSDVDWPVYLEEGAVAS